MTLLYEQILNKFSLVEPTHHGREEMVKVVKISLLNGSNSCNFNP